MIQFEQSAEFESVLEDLRTGRARVERRRRQRPLRDYLHLVSDAGEEADDRFEILCGAQDLLRSYINWQPVAHAC